MHEERSTVFRATTPESPLSTSLYHATSTIDDLTLALTNFSRVPSPEPPPSLACCCGNVDCENTRNWLSFKSKLESRLILSAEVGQALLKRHEAYVRQHERLQGSSEGTSAEDVDEDGSYNNADSRISELLKENVLLEKRLTRALVNNEAAETSNQTLLHELDEARDAVSRLTALHARSVGWDTRLMAVMQERDDMQQERDTEAQKAKLAEVRIAASKQRASKLQAEVHRLQEHLDQRRLHRLESSESILQDARARLEKLQHPPCGHTFATDHPEVTKVLEDLVADNETLKRDNAELQHLLADNREDLRVLQEEVEEQRAALPPRTPDAAHLLYPASTSSSVHKDHSTTRTSKRPASLEPRTRRGFEPLTPETDRQPLSPASSFAPPDTKGTTITQSHPHYSPSPISFEFDDDSHREQEPLTPEKPQGHKTLFLLTRSTGVQTDGWTGLLAPSPVPSVFGGLLSSSSPHDGRSESSSLVDPLSSHVAAIVERVAGLLSRITQADALTLTNRLKRQHLKGADVGHLSRTTVGSIVSEISNLRSQFRALLEDEKITTTCTRKDLRGLFKLFRDLFMELGQLRVTLNDIILDPSIADKVREMAMNPSKAEATERGRDAGNLGVGGWMAPISKLFGSPSGVGDGGQSNHSDTRQIRSGSRGRGPSARIVPKLGPALSASATTVNVEFSGMGVGRSVTSTFSAPSDEQDASIGRAAPIASPSPSNHVAKNIMDIFAGAPRAADGADPWIVVPKGSRPTELSRNNTDSYDPTTIGRAAMRNLGKGGRMSRQVDAVIDVDTPQGDESDVQPALLERTLRRRGLSDSSIHSTFMNQSDESRPPHATMHDGLSPRETWPERGSVLQSLSRRVQSFRFGGASASGIARPVLRTGDAGTAGTDPVPRLSSPILSGLLPHISSWTMGGDILNPDNPHNESPFVGSPPQDSMSYRAWAHESQGRDF